MAALKSAVELFKDSLSELSPTSQIQSITIDGDAVTVTMADADGQKLRVNLTYVEPVAYPRTSCLILLEDQDNRYADKISRLSERFQENAALTAVLTKARLYI